MRRPLLIQNSKALEATKFLANQAEIRKAIHVLAIQAKSLDLAGAFIGPEWQRLLANY